MKAQEIHRENKMSNDQYQNLFYKKAVDGKNGNLFNRVTDLENALKRNNVRDITNIINLIASEGVAGSYLSDVTTDATLTGDGTTGDPLHVKVVISPTEPVTMVSEMIWVDTA